MSTTSVRRVKERGEVGKVTSAVTGKISPVVAKSVSTGKENPRPTSRPRAATQKPSIRPMARIDKSAVEEPRSRWSTSSVPRGRSSSPSEITRALSDMRRNSSSRVSTGLPQKKLSSCNSSERSGEKCNIQTRVSKDLGKGGGVCDGLKGRSQNNEKIQIRVLKDCDSDKKERILSLGSAKRSDLEKRILRDSGKNEISSEEMVMDNNPEKGKAKSGVSSGRDEKKEEGSSLISDKISEFENFEGKSSLDLGVKIKSSEEVKLRSSGVKVEVGSSLRESKMVSKVSAYPKENGTNKHPSKLHEKLAFLEGKVKRIASDIKRTKDMLDMNNPDASKMILSDIQEKITGIEKAMGHVAGNDLDTNMGLVKTGGIKDNEEKKEVVDSKPLVRGLNVEELEARLFPHHKLIRDRTLSKSSSGGSETHLSKLGESSSSSNMEIDKITSADDNPIALEFLASLSQKEINVGIEDSEVQEVDDTMTSEAKSSSINVLNDKTSIDDLLMADENLNEFDEERTPTMLIEEDVEEDCSNQLSDIGCKTSTGGWFVSEGESILLAHDDGSCSYYDIANCEEKAEYKPPAGVSPNMWRDCWIIRAPSTDGCSGRYVVAASAGNSVDSGFCSWDFYTKKVHSFHMEDETSSHVRTALAPLPNNTMQRRNTLSTIMATENRQWWYKPCGPLMVSTATCQRMVQIYDIRDGDHVMKWELQKPVLSMDNSSPLQWRNRGKVVLAESDGISLWDVSSQSSQALMSVSSSGRKISALHVNNTDAELGGGVRQRISSSEAEGNDGFFCTPDSVNVLDFRHPSGIAFKIPNLGVSVQSGSSRGDSIYIGCTNLRSTFKKQSSQIQQFSINKQRLYSTYVLPESNAHHHFKALTQVWGNSNYVMGVCGVGLYVFDSLKDEGLPHVTRDYGNTQNAKEVIGPDDMYYPSFDYLSSRMLLISRDRPARWRYLF